MALFAGVPDYSEIIWRRDRYPDESGIEGLLSGLSSGMKGKSQYVSDTKAWEAGGGQGDKPNAFKYYFGAGRAEPQFTNSSEDLNGLLKAIDDMLNAARSGIK